MTESIVDGTGSGNKAGVNKNNRLLTATNYQSEEHFISSSEGLAYFANTTDTANTLTTTVNGGPVMYLKNNHSSKQLVIAKMTGSTDTSGTVVFLTKNPILGTIGNNNTHTPVGLNFGVSTEAAATCYTWNEVGDGMTGLSGGTKIKSFIYGTQPFIHQIDGAFILEIGDSLVVSVIGAGEFEFGIRFFYMDAEG